MAGTFDTISVVFSHALETWARQFVCGQNFDDLYKQAAGAVMTSCRPELCLFSKNCQRTSASDINILKRLTPNVAQKQLETK